MIDVSIIIPIYKVEQYIEECLRSIIIQENAGCLECILINDYTPDKSMEIAESFLNKYAGSIAFKIIHHNQNRGLSAARNTGVKNATGKYLYFLDSDDQLLPNAIKSLLHTISKHPFADFAIGDIQVEGANIKYPFDIPEIVLGKQIFIDYIMKKWYVMAWNKLINKDFFIKNNLWFIEGIVHEDIVFSFHLALYSSSMVCCKKATYIYKIRTMGSIMSQPSAQSYLDYYQGLKYNFQTIGQVIPYSTDIPIYRYIINSIYGFILSVNTNKDLPYSTKLKYSKNAQRLLKEMRKYKQSINTEISIKEVIIKLPYALLKSCINTHPIIRKILYIKH